MSSCCYEAKWKRIEKKKKGNKAVGSGSGVVLRKDKEPGVVLEQGQNGNILNNLLEPFAAAAGHAK